MPLQGTFDVLDFSDVLHLIARHELTGRLYVRHRSFGANLFVESGLLTGADQSEHQPAAASGDVVGRIAEVCFEMLEAERGSFEFHPGKAGSLPTSSRHQVDAVLDQSRKRLEEWRDLQSVIPSLDLQPRLLLEMGRAEVTLDQERWRVLTSIDGRRNLRAIGRVVNLSDFDVCRMVRGLMDDGMVELEGLAALSASNREALPVLQRPPVDHRQGAGETGIEGTGAVTVVAERPPSDTDEPAGSRDEAKGNVPAGRNEARASGRDAAGQEGAAGRDGTVTGHTANPGSVTPVDGTARVDGVGPATPDIGTDGPRPSDSGDQDGAAPDEWGTGEHRAATEEGQGHRRGRLVRIRSREPKPGRD